MKDLYKKDYLEILDMEKEELKKYSKEELIKTIWQLASELYEKENN